MNYGPQFLEHGLNILARAHEHNYFADGHRGAAVIAAYFFLQANPQLISTRQLMAEQVNALWITPRKYAPLPEEKADPELLTKITATMENNMRGLRQVGHNVILPSLALKAFDQRPELITSTRVTGICKMIESFTIQATELSSPVEDFPNFDESVKSAEFILKEFTHCTQRFIGRGQGWSGHLLTYGMSIFDLRNLGYIDLARKAETGFRLYIDRIRQGPLDIDKERAEHPQQAILPIEDAYWVDKTGDWHLGHILKYPYGFYKLLEKVEDRQLIRACLQSAYHIF